MNTDEKHQKEHRIWLGLAVLLAGGFYLYYQSMQIPGFGDFDIAIEPQVARPGDELKVQVTLKNRLGGLVPSSMGGELYHVLEARSHWTGRHDRKQFIKLAADPSTQAIWRGSFTMPKDSGLVAQELWTYRSKKIVFERAKTAVPTYTARIGPPEW